MFYIADIWIWGQDDPTEYTMTISNYCDSQRIQMMILNNYNEIILLQMLF